MVSFYGISRDSVVKEVLVPVSNPPVSDVVKNSSAQDCGSADEDCQSD